MARGFELSSNTVMVQAVYENYKSNPSQFVNHLVNFGLNKPLGLQLKGEGIPYVPNPKDKLGVIFRFLGWLLVTEFR